VQIYLPKDYHLVAFRLDSGENLNIFLEDHLRLNGAGFICLFSLQAQIDAVTLGFWNAKAQKYATHKIRPRGYSQLEPTTISGNATWVGEKPFAHIHGGVCHADPKKKGRFAGGGHFTQTFIGRTGEGFMLVGDDETPIMRVLNPEMKCNVKEWCLPKGE